MSLATLRILLPRTLARTFHRRISTLYAACHHQQQQNVPRVILSTNEFGLKPTTFDRLSLQPPPPTESSSLPLQSVKQKSALQHNTFEFVDCCKVRVSGGRGGDGMICYLHLFCNPNAGPSGGDGGHGGHIIFEACTNVHSLNQVKSSYTGTAGENGMSKDMTGRNAEHTVIKLPIGTLVRDAYTKKLIAEMDIDGIKFLAARGGSGGKGNHYFLSNENRHPNVAEIGALGESKFYLLELKIMAHAGLIGLPNAGKSTLLKAISRAKPKVANYPFTTLKPTVGVIPFSDGSNLRVADLPGLIEGAHQNKGLGIGFLRHVARCVCLFYVLDISEDNPYEQLRILMNELEAYKEELSSRPMAIVANKMDVDGAEEKLVELCDRLKANNLSHLTVVPVSAKYNQNLINFLLYFKHLFDTNRLESKDVDDFF